MAEFKLGRIRFVWKGDWTTSTTYYQDDVVAYGGKTYICVIGHDSQSNFFSDFDVVPPKWNLVADGQTWKGSWQTSTSYVYDDIVLYGGTLYIANTNHTSAATLADGLEADQSKWTVFQQGLDWKGIWATSIRYKVNDVVKYGGTTYVCNTAHTSAATDADGLELDQAKWDYFNQGIEYKQAWSSVTRYKVNDVIKYGATLWICTTEHTSSAEFGTDSANWQIFVEGLQYEAEWLYTNEYQPGDIVSYGGNQYVAKTDNENKIPPAFADDWDLLAEGIKFLDDWGADSASYEYKVGELVRLGGYTYVCIQDHQNQQPPNATYWKRLNTGIDWRGEWLDDAEYFLGDVVRFGDNSYICVFGHISEGDDGSSLGGAANSRPDLDISGTYWNIVSIGTEQSVLTTTGDLVYYAGNGPARLPIGLNGQVLTVNENNLPEWAFLGSSEDVYYVAEHGFNEPAPVYGQTIDRPWRSIRYACEQVERGAKNPVTKELLELNRKFIQREIVEWTDYQITSDIAPFTTAFSYNSAKCERDMGLIVDAIVWDITHGGNVRSREAALSYVNDTVGSPYLTQKTETVASINYGLQVIQAVLNQTAPTVNYQALNGDNSTAVVAQYTNSNVIAEDTYTRITELVKIITDAITAGVTTNIPARDIRTSLIKVSAGKFYETLPIIVPAETCVMGDELRATTVAPRKASNSTLTPKADARYSIKALERIENVIGDIVTGGTVTSTTGNSEVQSQVWPYAETAVVAPQVEKLVRSIKRQIDHKIGNKIEANLTPAYSLSDPNYGRSRDLFLQNKDFIRAEIIAYIGDTYPNIKYSKTKCKQDVGYIMDAIAYDLTYGGNWQSVVAGEAYWNGASGNLQIDSSEKIATVAAYNYLKTLLQTVGRNITVTPTYQTAVSQISGTGGSITVSNVIGTLMDDIIDTINDGYQTVTVTYPTITNADALTVKTALDNAKPTIQESTIDFISKNFGSFTYNSATCRRDLDRILTAVAYDTQLGTNYNTVYAGIAYQRPNNAYNLQNQRIQTVGAIRNARNVTLDDATLQSYGETAYLDRAEAGFNEIVDIINNGSLGTATPGDGVVDALVFDDTTALNQDSIDAKDNLVANREFIKAEITAWIDDQISGGAGIWSGFTYDDVKCARDVGYIVDGMCHDVMYGGNLAAVRIAQSYFGDDGTAYPAGQAAQTAAAYDRLATVLSQVVQEQSVTTSSGNLLTQTTLGSPATATEGTVMTDNMQIIEDVLTAGDLTGLPSITYPTTPVSGGGYDYDVRILAIKDDVILDTIQYINTTYNDFKYNQAKCSRDVGLIIDAAIYDFGLSTNYASLVSAYSYLRAPSANVLKDQKTASIAAFEFARTLVIDEVPVGAQYDFARTGINDTWEWIDDVILGGSGEGGNNTVEDPEVHNAIRQLELNKDFIVAEAQAFVDEYFKDTVTATTDTTEAITISDTGWLELGMGVKFSDDATAGAVTAAGLTAGTTYYVRDILSATTFTVSATVGGTVVDLVDTSDAFNVVTAYEYNKTTCARDIKEYVNAIKYDLTWPQEWERSYTDNIKFYRPGSYRTRLAARYYTNAVLGSQEEDFYYLRNGTGLRLQTMDGLEGDLTAPNEFGTSRVTAGAYASLDPGWGPDDRRVWISARSPYVQNCTTFGYAATGQKIDGALHNGGNDSIVSNDFTQVISDGIGAHILNNGRAELVSVFTYYSHIGYLAETGGRVRATNGNNSYGTFGSVAEGVDPDEIPVTAIVDNALQYNATISNLFTNNDELQQMEFGHAGNDYTEAVFNIFGAGSNEDVLADEFRDDAVFRVRVDEINDSSGAAGGSGYLIVGNTAQAGSTTGIFLAATDGNVSSAYPGMAIYITGGAGIGQYGIIDTYNAGSKEATVVKESDGTAGWDHIVAGTTIVAPNSSSTYQIEPHIVFSAPTKTQTTAELAGTADILKLAYSETAAQYTNVSASTESDGRGVTFDVTRNGGKYYVSLNTGGTGYQRLDTVSIHGSSVGGVDSVNDITLTVTTINEATGAIVDFDFSGVGQKGLFVALDGSTTLQKSIDGATWTTATLPSAGGGDWAEFASGLQDDGSSTFKQSAAVAVATTSGNVAYSTDDELATWTGATLPGGFSPGTNPSIAFGYLGGAVNKFVVISEADQDIAYSVDNGQNWTLQATALPSTGYSAITYGKGQFVAVRTASNDAATSTDGQTWTLQTLPTTSAWRDVTWGNGRYVAISTTADGTDFEGAYSLDGVNWVAMTIPGVTTATASPASVAYGQGVFVITYQDSGTATGSEVAYSENGITWTVYDHTNAIAGGQNGIAFGNPNREGKFIMAPKVTSDDTFVIARIGATARGRPSIANEKIFEVRITEPGSCYDAGTPPTITVDDPNNINEVLLIPRIGKGALANPTYINRGSGFTTASAEIEATQSNGNADFFQDGSFIAVRRLTERPVPGSNIEFGSLPGTFFKLVNVVSFLGTNDGSYTAFLQISPEMSIQDAPANGDSVEMRIRFSQVRLTGHDFLDIGTGNFVTSNYPNTPLIDPDQNKETQDSDGGRVFYTATDQDGNFRVGDLFSVEQATGVATLNAEAFNIAGLQELTLGEVTLGGNSASVSEFSTDPFFTANSDSIVPTQRAVKAYIEAQIGGGGASLVVNSVTAGDIFIGTDQITTVSGSPINILANVVFKGSVLGIPLAYQYFLR